MNEALFWDWDNLQGMCRQCHSRKTATHDGGFGHKRPA
jgi:5-methylcytosine-specific restriction protein A